MCIDKFYVCVNICLGTCVFKGIQMSGIILNSLPTFFTETEALNQTQSSLICLVNLASLVWEFPLSTFCDWNYRWDAASNWYLHVL